MEHDSDDECVPGMGELPKINNDPSVVEFKLDFGALERGETQDLSFEMPEVVETDGHKENHPQCVQETFTKKRTFEKMTFPFVAEENKDILTVMFGDYSEIEAFMCNVNEDGSIKKRLIRPGTGKKVESTDVVGVHYMIGVECMDDLIESTYENKRHRRYRMNSGQVLPVMEEGLLTMRVGEIAKFLATSEYGYGKLGVPLMDKRVIPPDSRVMIQLEVVEGYPYQKSEGILRMSSTERAELPFEKLYKYAEAMKEEGNREMRDGEYDEACRCYKNSLEAIKDMCVITPDQGVRYCRIRNMICNNLAIAYFKRGKFGTAAKYAESGTVINCNGLLKAKSHFWLAKSFYELGRYQLCNVQVEIAASLRPNLDPDIENLKAQVQAKLKIFDKEEKEFCARMMKAEI